MDLYLIPGIVGTALQMCVLHILIRGAYRRYPGIAVYVAVVFLTGIADATVYLNTGWWPQWYLEYYFLNSTVRHVAGFVALVSLVYLASAACERRGPVLRISLAAATVIAASLVTARGEWPGEYMNEASRNLSFATVILNIALWLYLAKSRPADHRLFMVSAGLGINMAGEAVGQSLLRMAAEDPNFLTHVGGIITIGSHILCLLIWWKALRQLPQESPLTRSASSQ